MKMMVIVMLMTIMKKWRTMIMKLIIIIIKIIIRRAQRAMQCTLRTYGEFSNIGGQINFSLPLLPLLHTEQNAKIVRLFHSFCELIFFTAAEPYLLHRFCELIFFISLCRVYACQFFFVRDRRVLLTFDHIL